MFATTEISIGFLVRVALAVPLFLVLPGRLMLRLLLGERAGPGPSTRPGRAFTEATVEASFLGLISSIAVCSWLAILLAELGWLSFDALLVVVGAVCLALWLYLRAASPRAAALPRPAASPRSDPSGRAAASPRTAARMDPRLAAPALGLLAVLLLAAIAFLPPFQSVIWASDATTYLNFGQQVSETGSFLFDDHLLADIPVPSRQQLFSNVVPGDVTGQYARFPGGFLIPEISETKVTAGFSPLFPVLIALAYLLLGLGGALYVAPLLAMLGVGAIYLIGARLRSVQAGLLAAGLVTVSLPQIWFSRLGTAEVVAECFVFAGLLALLLARERPRMAAAGGALFGLAIFAKFDLVAVLSFAVMGFLVIALWSGSDARRIRVKYFVIAFFPLLLHAVIHFLVFPSHYEPFFRSKIDSLFAPLGVSITDSPALVVLLFVVAASALGSMVWWALNGNRRASKTGAYVLLALMVAYSFAYLGTSTNHLRETLAWLVWYLSWPVLVLFLLAAVMEIFKARGEPEVSSLFVFVLAGSAALHYLYDPHEPIAHIWSMRRFVPILLPAMLLILSIAVVGVRDHFSWRGWRWMTPAIGLLLLGLVAQPSMAIVGEPLWEGAIDTTAEVAALFPPDAVVLVGSDLSGTHLAPTLTYSHDAEAVLLRERYLHPPLVEDVVIEWLVSGRRVFLLIGPEASHLPAPRLSLSWLRDIDLELRMLETTTSRIPATVFDQRKQMGLYAVAESAEKRSVEVGTVAEDFLFGLHGFHAAERSPDPSLGTFRWTGEVAEIELPGAGDEIRIVLDGERPEGTADARISVRVNQVLVIEGLVVPRSPTTITVQNPREHRGLITGLTIESNVFTPRDLGLSTDGRELGVKLYRVEF